MTDNAANDELDLSLPPGSPRRRWLTIVAALVLFLAGMASGAALTIVFAVNRLQFAIHHPESAPPRIAAAIARRLDLDQAQTSKVEKIIARHQQQILAIRHRLQPEIVAQLDSVREAVAEVLDPSQRERWVELFAQFKERWLPQLPNENP